MDKLRWNLLYPVGTRVWINTHNYEIRGEGVTAGVAYNRVYSEGWNDEGLHVGVPVVDIEQYPGSPLRCAIPLADLRAVVEPAMGPNVIVPRRQADWADSNDDSRVLVTARQEVDSNAPRGRTRQVNIFDFGGDSHSLGPNVIVTRRQADSNDALDAMVYLATARPIQQDERAPDIIIDEPDFSLPDEYDNLTASQVCDKWNQGSSFGWLITFLHKEVIRFGRQTSSAAVVLVNNVEVPVVEVGFCSDNFLVPISHIVKRESDLRTNSLLSISEMEMFAKDSLVHPYIGSINIQKVTNVVDDSVNVKYDSFWACEYDVGEGGKPPQQCQLEANPTGHYALSLEDAFCEVVKMLASGRHLQFQLIESKSTDQSILRLDEMILSDLMQEHDDHYVVVDQC